ncbi:MAG: LPS translocon maturation chaperone LptM [Gammaproteobacteria bacterium]
MKFFPHFFYVLTLPGVAGCGQPGPLYLPDNPPPGYKAAADDDQPAPIPERDIDQAPPRIEAAPPKPAEEKPKPDLPPTETPQ